MATSSPKTKSSSNCNFDVNSNAETKQLSTQSIQTDIAMKYLNHISLLESKWITDDVIGTFYNILSENVTESSTFLMNPIVAQALKCLDDTDYLLDPLELKGKEIHCDTGQ